MPKEKVRKKPFAVFDIDGTIFRSSLLIELVEALINEGYFPKSAKTYYEKEFQSWQNRFGSYDDYIQRIIEVYLKHIKGIHIEEIIDVSNRVLHFKKDRVYMFTRDLVKKLKKTHFLLAISHSPFHIVEPFARDLGFNKVYAVWYQTNDSGILTGAMEHTDLIFSKGKVLDRAIEKENLTLARSIGVGDSEGDIEMLKMVKKAIAFNPNKILYSTAKRNKWEIVIERKNVIHKIK